MAIAFTDPEHELDMRLGELAHELRDPLASILMGIGLIARVGPSEAVLHQLTSTVKSMNGLIDHLLSFARTRPGALHLARRPVALAGCREVIDELLIAFPRRRPEAQLIEAGGVFASMVARVRP